MSTADAHQQLTHSPFARTKGLFASLFDSIKALISYQRLPTYQRGLAFRIAECAASNTLTTSYNSYIVVRSLACEPVLILIDQFQSLPEFDRQDSPRSRLLIG